jgi:predicted transcriptional regulator
MTLVDELIIGILRGPDGFKDALKKILDEDLKMSVNEFCERTGLSTSTIYKIMQEKREPNLRTVRSVLRAIRTMEKQPGGPFIAVIASRGVLNKIEERMVQVGDKVLKVKEYPAATMEEAIIAAVMAERDGALAVVCAPIVAPTVEKILSIPVSIVIPRDSLIRAIDNAAKKAL